MINLYQRTPLKTHSMCRFNPTCSEYMKIAIERFGFKGFLMGIWRIIRCNPLCKGGYNPVPEIKNKERNQI